MALLRRLGIGLMFVVFVVAGFAGFCQQFAIPMWRHIQAGDWQSTPCRIAASRIDEGELKLTFQYSANGKARESGRYSFLPVGTYEDLQSRELMARYPAGSEGTCYVNPRDPDDVVLDRELPPRVWNNATLLILVVIGAVGLGWMLGGIRRQPITDARLERLCLDGSRKSLNVKGSLITDSGLRSLHSLTALSDLDLSRTQITDGGLREIARLKSLKLLTLDHTRITDRGIEDLVALDQLSYLSLENTKVTDRSIAILGQMSNLEDLNLTGTAVTPEGIERLRVDLPDCEIEV